MQTKKIGRPLKQPPKDAVEIIRDIASRGCSEKTVLAALGTSRETWSRWKTEYPELLDAYEEARAVEHDKLVGVLFERALKGDTVAAMFLLKCRHNYRDGGIVLEDNRSVKIGIMLPQSLKPEQYQQIICNNQEVIENG